MKTNARVTRCFAVLLLTLLVAPAYSQGGLDTFNPQLNGGVESTAVQPDGKILISGTFTRVANRYVTNLARLHPDGSMDTNFIPRIGMYGRRIVVQPDGKILVGGLYNQNRPDFRGVVRFETNGSVDPSFDAPVPRDMPFALAVQTDGKILLGFSYPPHMLRLLENGSVDTNFLARPDSVVYDLAIQPDGKILVAGYFEKMNGQTRRLLARLNADGSLDASFNADVTRPGSSGAVVRKVAVQADGKILFGGWFTAVQGESRLNLARLNPNGTLDRQFTANADWEVHALVVQPNGKIVVTGNFTAVNGQSRVRLARVNWDGSLDPTLIASANDFIRTAALQPDGKTVFGGQFGMLSGAWQSGVGRIASDPSSSPVFIDLASMKVLEGGAIQFSFLNPNALAFSVLASEDVTAPLASWENLGAATVAAGAVFQFTDTAAASHPRRLYKLRAP